MTIDDVRRIAAALPATTEGPDGLRWLVAGKAFAWCWMERVDPKRPRLCNPSVVAVSVPDEADKRRLVTTEPATFFTEAHYDGYAAVLVRLEAITESRLAAVLEAGWRARAPRSLGRDAGA